ncbi:MAG: carbonic anhydrase family protein [Lacipirellulaceae bacterium]
MSMPQQSPVNLESPISTQFGANQLKVRWRKSARGTIITGGHGTPEVRFNANDADYILLDRCRYHLVNFHFHSPSEHWLAGKQQRMELHIVHQNAQQHGGGRAAIGVFIEPKKASRASKISRSGSKNGNPPAISTNPWDWLPTNFERYYRYEGSLTTPAYTENVSWIVLKEPLRCTVQEFKKLSSYYGGPARLPQPLNRRFLLANF